jgi:hypothetical protein
MSVKKPTKAKVTIKAKPAPAKAKAGTVAAKAKPAGIEGSLLDLLDDMGEDKTAAMAKIHVLLSGIEAVIDKAISKAEGDLKAMLKALRGFL